MGQFNKVLLLGNLCQEPEIRYSAEGNAFCQVGIATNRKWTDKSGELQEEVCFVDIKAFGRTAEIMGEYLRKGSQVFIEGRLSYYRWDDDEGNPHSKHSIVIESLQMLGKQEATPRESPEKMNEAAETNETKETEEEIPF